MNSFFSREFFFCLIFKFLKQLQFQNLLSESTRKAKKKKAFAYNQIDIEFSIDEKEEKKGQEEEEEQNKIHSIYLDRNRFWINWINYGLSLKFFFFGYLFYFILFFSEEDERIRK